MIRKEDEVGLAAYTTTIVVRKVLQWSIGAVDTSGEKHWCLEQNEDTTTFPHAPRILWDESMRSCLSYAQE